MQISGNPYARRRIGETVDDILQRIPYLREEVVKIEQLWCCFDVCYDMIHDDLSLVSYKHGCGCVQETGSPFGSEKTEKFKVCFYSRAHHHEEMLGWIVAHELMHIWVREEAKRLVIPLKARFLFRQKDLERILYQLEEVYINDVLVTQGFEQAIKTYEAASSSKPLNIPSYVGFQELVEKVLAKKTLANRILDLCYV